MKRLIVALLLTGLVVGLNLDAVASSATARATMTAGLILLGGHIAGHLLARIGLPRITGYLGLGILLGPFTLAVIDERTAGLLGFLRELAVAFIALAAGAELRVEHLRERFSVIVRLTTSTTLGVGGLVFVILYGLNDVLPLAAGATATEAICLAMLFAILAVARSPSSALAVIRECRARGAFPETVLGVTVAADVFSIVLFAVGLSFCQALISSVLDVSFALALCAELVGGVLMGIVLGGALAFYIARAPGNLALLLLGTALVVTHLAHGIAGYVRDTHDLPVHLEPLLICVTAGFTVRNLSRGGDPFGEAIERVSLPVFVLFFCLAGASLDLIALRTMWSAALLYVVVRTLCLVGSCWVVTGGDEDRPWYGLSFLTQAGVSVGLALEVVNRFPDWGGVFATIAVAAISLNQLIGPVAMKWALQRASSSKTR